ncbi:MAG: hypothetical protein ABIP74_01020 [Candidatus Saccharimonas sp.]
MEKSKPIIEFLDEKRDNLKEVFGSWAEKITAQIAHDNPELTEDEVIDYAYFLIPEATEYMHPAYQEDLAKRAIDVHEGYEALRRTED